MAEEIKEVEALDVENDLFHALTKIQVNLKAPKNQWNDFGKYKYRNAEDIEGALKPLLLEHGCTLTLTETLCDVGGYIFVQSKAVLRRGFEHIETVSYGVPNFNRKGADYSQIIGAAASYARKYALGGMFLVDDMPDADADEPKAEVKTEPKAEQKPNALLQPIRDRIKDYAAAVGTSIDDAIVRICSRAQIATFDDLKTAEQVEEITALMEIEINKAKAMVEGGANAN